MFHYLKRLLTFSGSVRSFQKLLLLFNLRETFPSNLRLFLFFLAHQTDSVTFSIDILALKIIMRIYNRFTDVEILGWFPYLLLSSGSGSALVSSARSDLQQQVS